eukprot:COSAG02_NODE_47253_length_342_cov_1.131687_1_plen_47_part_01
MTVHAEAVASRGDAESQTSTQPLDVRTYDRYLQLGDLNADFDGAIAL